MRLQAKSDQMPPAEPKKRLFVLSDFGLVLANVPKECPLVGGQAVAWWCKEFCPADKPITSYDIDFWGFREHLKSLARALGQKPVFPHDYEMTIWVGGVPLIIRGEKTTAEFINTVPGLDTFNPEKASVRQKFSWGSQVTDLLVLSPISLVLAKLYALRAFEQKDRQDEFHLRVSLATAKYFIEKLLENGETRQSLWNVERLIAASQNKPYERLETDYTFDIQSAIPIDRIQECARRADIFEEDRNRFRNFCEIRWPRVKRTQPTRPAKRRPIQ